MRHLTRSIRIGLLPGLLAVLAVALSACGSGPGPRTAADDYAYTASIDVSDPDIAANLEAALLEPGVDLLLRDEANDIVVVAMTEAAHEALAPSLDLASHLDEGDALGWLLGALEPNEALYPPELLAAGWEEWSMGWEEWSMGWEEWSMGWEEWSMGDAPPSLPDENGAHWQQLDLATAFAGAVRYGEGITVAVVDTGLDLDHPMFAGRLASPAAWLDVVDGDRRPAEQAGSGDSDRAHGHGTGVAGIVLQVAPRATILPIRALDSAGRSDVARVVRAIEHAVAAGADVLQLSLGSTVESTALHDAVTYAAERGVLVVAAAGNAGTEGAVYPARYADAAGALGRHTFGVASVTPGDVKSAFSNYGAGVDLAAPGESIVTAAPDARLGAWSGTSFAAPVVAGTAALALGEAAAAVRDEVAVALLLAAADLSGSDPVHGALLGAGRLDAAAALEHLRGGTNPGAFTIARHVVEARENDGAVVVEVTRAGGSDGPASLDWATVDGSAVAGTDYAAASGTLTWADGEEGLRQVTLTLLDDDKREDPEAFRVAFTNPVGALGTADSVEIAVADDETAGRLRFTKRDKKAKEDDGFVEIDVERVDGRTGPASVVVSTVQFSARKDADYLPLQQTVSWLDGEDGKKRVRIALVDDAAEEDDEVFAVILHDASGARIVLPSLLVIEIEDDDD